jgi:hypothetical protein
MKRSAVALLAVLAVGGCSDEPNHQIYFSGSVWNGATGEKVTSYKIRALVQRDEAVSSSVNSAGQYLIGPLEPWNDFTIEIEADGYRSFHSHNRMLGLPGVFNDPDEIEEHTSTQSYVFDAVLFPESLATPATTLFVVSEQGDTLLNGKVRLAPTDGSALTLDDPNTNAPIPGQLWTNDDDRQVGTLVKDFTGGQVELAAGELVYGVMYNVSIYDVPEHQLTSVFYQAGINGNQRYVVETVSSPPFAMLTMTKQNDPAATVEITFSETIEFALHPSGLYNETHYREFIDDNFSISSGDADADGVYNILKSDASPSVQERGTSITITGNKLVLSWNRTTGLQTSDAEDPIGIAYYQGLSSIYVQPVGKPDDRTPLSSLIGSSWIAINDFGS